MPTLQYDFTPSRSLGVIQPVLDGVLAMANSVDVWTPDAADMNFAAGKISAWRGRKAARVLGQANAARQPVLESGLVRMSSSAQAAVAQLDLEGTQLGALGAFTIAVHARIHPEQLGVDNHYFWGTGVAGSMFRLAYRFTSGNRYIRLTTRDTATNIDVALPADWNGVVGVVVTYSAGVLTMYLTTGLSGSRSITTPSTIDIQTLSVGNAVINGVGSLRGFIGPFGVWTRAATQQERELLLSWVA